MSGNTHWTKSDEAFVLSQVKDYGGKIPSSIIDGMAVELKDRSREAIRHKAKRLQAQHGAQLQLLSKKPAVTTINIKSGEHKAVKVDTPYIKINHVLHKRENPYASIDTMLPMADEPVGIEPEPKGSGRDVSDVVWFTGVALIGLGFIVAFVLLYQWLG